MSEFPETRDSLLVQVQDPANRDAWEMFARIYRPVIVRIARARGLQHADARQIVPGLIVQRDDASHRLVLLQSVSLRFRKDSATNFKG